MCITPKSEKMSEIKGKTVVKERFAQRALHSMSASLDAKKDNIVHPV